MINLSDAGGRIMYSYKELSELAGYADRVFNMINVMNELAENRFVKPLSTSGQEFVVDRISGVTKYDQNCRIVTYL
jgi:ATP-binding cassette subfamily D (ALD) long-chain fatty acid import protein